MEDIKNFHGGRFALKAHRHSYYAIVIITKGEGRHFIDFTAYEIKPGCLYCIAPGQVHFWQINTSLSGFELLFTHDFLVTSQSHRLLMNKLSFLHNHNGGNAIHSEPSQLIFIKDLLKSIYSEYISDSFARKHVLQSYLHILLIHIQRLYKSAPITQDRSIASKFKQMVSKSLPEKKKVQEYADLIGISPGHLGEIIKSTTGKTPGMIIREETALEAKRLLSFTDMTIAEIGYYLGFEDPSYFGRFFTRETGMTPSVFRSSSIW